MSEKIPIMDRTFGFELEFGNVNKKQVSLPEGYRWSPDERSIVNSDSKKSTPSGDYGGELNTRPLQFCRSDLREMRGVIKKCFDAGGVLMWNTGFDGHLYIGDLELDDLKKIFALGFYVSPLLNKVFNLGGWFNVEHLVPTPTYEFNERVQKVETIDALKNVFANSSNRGHFRFQINIMPYFKTKTLEYRLFNSSASFRDTLETVKFMYSFLDYALTRSIDDFKAIETEEDFMREFGITRPFADKTAPLIFAESHKEATRNIAKAFSPSRKIISAVIADTSDKLLVVNPFYYQVELALYKAKQICIYNNSEFNHIVYLICTGGLCINYTDHFEVLGEYKDGSQATELSLFFIFARIQKYNIDTDYGINEFMAHVNRIGDSLAKMKPNSDALVEMFGECEYVAGNLGDALNRAMDEGGQILFQQEFNSKTNSAVTALKKYSGYGSDFVAKSMRYENIDKCLCDAVKLLVISKNDFLPYEKIARDLDTTLYSSKKSYLGVRQVVDDGLNVCIQTPDDDFKICMDTHISVNEVRPAFFSVLQSKFVKKVSKFQQPRICYTINSGMTILGAFGFDYSKDGDYNLFLLSDFCTNNEVRLLSKFVLFVIRSKEAQKMIERKLVERVQKGYTKVYTTMPVSMKYRGAFKKVGSDGKSLAYEFEFGSMGTIEDAKREYIKRCK